MKEFEKFTKEYIGSVVWFRPDAGFRYGFIKISDEYKDVFVHYSDIIMDGFKTLKQGQKVKFKVGDNKRGEPKAIEVIPIDG